MKSREFKCVKILTDLIENDGLIGIKTSFEDEGALFEETIRLKEVCNQAKTKITLKIGGPEAIRDIKDSSIIGVKASNLLLLFRFVSWLPQITIVGLLVANSLNKYEVMLINSGLMSVLACTISPPTVTILFSGS